MRSRKYPAISVHKTLNNQLKVDWERMYHKEYNCPYCETGKLTSLIKDKSYFSQLRLKCNLCKKSTCLTCKLPGVGSKHYPISQHQTLKETLKVDWNLEYCKEYNCPRCNQQKLTQHTYHHSSICKLVLVCNNCKLKTSLTCQVPVHISNYRPQIECPNPLCTNVGYNGQKGWIYKIEGKNNNCKCYFCQIVFNPNSIAVTSWVGSQMEKKLRPFSFNEDIWELGHFYDKPYQKILNFKSINPEWYRQEVKKYLDYLLKSKRYSSDSILVQTTAILRQFGQIIADLNIKDRYEINRNTLIQFFNICKRNGKKTVNRKLSILRYFFDWLDLETLSLIRSRDFFKISQSDADWLDEVTRQSIKHHLDKIPAPIAHYYLVQVYIAARPRDVCQLAFDCLEKQNDNWYIKFFQQKTKRWHRILANRQIRKVIEAQQQWIRKTLGQNYRYLFCHFRNIRQKFYPTFENIKPLPKPPIATAGANPMVRIIRWLIEQEDIRDTNGQRPLFTGRITRSSRLQEVRVKYGIEAAQLYADHKSSSTTFQHYTPPTQEQVAEVDLPFQELLMNRDNKFLPWQSLPESLLKNPKAYELDLEIAPRLIVYGYCALDPKTPCPYNLYPKCYGCSSFCPSTGKLHLYERQYEGERRRLAEAEKACAELASEEAKSTIEAMDKWLPQLRRLAND